MANKVPDNLVSPKRSAIVSALMLCTLCFILFFSQGEAVPLKQALDSFPKTIGEWNGREAFFDAEIYEVLGVDDSALINYQDAGSNFIQLYVGYYDSQREGDLIHSPKNCMPGSGWEITETSLVKINIPSVENRNINAIKLRIEKGPHHQVVLYWFQSRGRFISSEYSKKIYLLLDMALKGRSDGAFVRLIAPIGPDGEAYTTDYLKTFSGDLIPVLEEYLPGS